MGGSASEMARLINETGVLGEAMKVTAQTVKDVPFDKMIEAVHKVQVELGITGTTSLEAANTIQGSVNSMKASWSNLLTSIADDNADLSKSVDEFIGSTITASKNLVPRIKQVVEGIKKLINSVINDVFPRLKKEIPQLAPLIDTFNWFIKNKSLVIGAMTAMVSAFAINKILSFSKALSDSAKKILDIAKSTTVATTATKLNTKAEVTNTATKVAATGATTALTVATNLLNAAWRANPIGLVITGISALIGVIGFLRSKTNEVTKAEREHSKALKEAVEQAEEANKAYDDLRKTQQKQIDASMTEINHYQSLYDELQNIVDQNGKVKKGYEERASFITSTLSDALGVEIKNVDGVIQGYNTLKNTIDQVMEKKKAQIILDSQETLYKEAINGQTEALKKLTEAESSLKERQEGRKALEEELIPLQEKFNELIKNSVSASMKSLSPLGIQLQQIQDKIKAYDEDTANVQENYNQQKELLSKFAYDIGQYEKNMAVAHAGEYEKMIKVNWEYVKDYQVTGEAEKAMLENQIKITEANLNLLKELKTKSGSDIYNQQIQDAEKQLEEHKKSLKKYEEVTKIGLDATKIQWQNGLDEILSEITQANIEFKEDGEGNIQMYADGIKSGEPKTKEEMAKLITNTIKEITNKDEEAKKAGEYLIEGVNNGVKNQDKQNSVFRSISNFGSAILSRLKSSLQEQSPSKATKEMGIFLLEGLGLGIEKEEGSVLKQVSNFGKSVISSLNSGLSDSINMGGISDIASNITTSSYNGSYYNNELNMVEAFKEALSQMTIELDDENMGKFIDKTVAKTIYS